MNKIVRDHYPVSKLPEDLRVGLPEGAEAEVTVVVKQPAEQGGVRAPLSLAEIFARPLGTRSKAEIDAELAAERENW